jgi:hypothetical protein
MPAILLGAGYLPGDAARRERLEVHLHPEHPATPISLGVRWGGESTGASFALQQLTALRHHDHLRACGCEWLKDAARDEWLRGRTMTPDELLARWPGRPAAATATATAPAPPSSTGLRSSFTTTPPPAPPPPPPAARPPRPDPEVLARLRAALDAEDYPALEHLRDVVDDAVAGEVVAWWRPELPWERKDAFAALLLDQHGPGVEALYRDALRSPTLETRAYAVCVLSQDVVSFERLMVDRRLDPGRVAAAIAALPPGR